ncbi:MAG: hypothetical protein SGPRY_008264 [Prymnesium sp.]
MNAKAAPILILRPGWREERGPQGVYFVNDFSGESSWEKPTAEAPPMAEVEAEVSAATSKLTQAEARCTEAARAAEAARAEAAVAAEEEARIHAEIQAAHQALARAEANASNALASSQQEPHTRTLPYVYFFHAASGETSWSRPVVDGQLPDTEEAKSAAAAEKVKKEMEEMEEEGKRVEASYADACMAAQQLERVERSVKAELEALQSKREAAQLAASRSNSAGSDARTRAHALAEGARKAREVAEGAARGKVGADRKAAEAEAERLEKAVAEARARAAMHGTAAEEETLNALTEYIQKVILLLHPLPSCAKYMRTRVVLY